MARSRGGYASRPKQQAPFMLTKLRRRLVHSRRVQILENIFFCWRQKAEALLRSMVRQCLGMWPQRPWAGLCRKAHVPSSRLDETGVLGAWTCFFVDASIHFPQRGGPATEEKERKPERSHAEDREREYRSSEITKLPDKKQTEGAKERNEELFVMWQLY